MNNKTGVICNIDLNAFYTFNEKRSYLEMCISEIEFPDSVFIHAVLPQGKQLIDFQNGALFEITHTKYGKRDAYCEEDVILRLEHCRVLRKWLDDVIVHDPSDERFLTINLQLGADIKFLLKEGE